MTNKTTHCELTVVPAVHSALHSAVMRYACDCSYPPHIKAALWKIAEALDRVPIGNALSITLASEPRRPQDSDLGFERSDWDSWA
jgi:hypothetical protein